MTVVSLPANASIFTRIRIGIEALKVLKDDAGHPVYGPLLGACLDMGTYSRRAAALRATAWGRELLDSRPSLQGGELRLEELEKLPADSLGYAFAKYFRDNKLEPFITTFEINSDVDFIAKRFRETHDLMHVMTGYATDGAGEMELQAFMLSNFKGPSSALILAFASPLLLKMGEISFFEYAKRLAAAFLRGMRARDLFDVAYENHWHAPLAAMQAQHGVAT